MTTKNVSQITTQKPRIFSITTQIQEVRTRLVTNAPQEAQQQGQTIRRVRAD